MNIKIKRGTTIPTTNDLVDGELGFNTENNRIYIGDGSSVHELLGPGIKTLTYEEYRELEDIDDNTIYLCTDEFDEILTPDNALINMGITANASEINVLDGILATVTELNYIKGVTSNVQTQINEKALKTHYHDTSDITSGTLQIANGGTGVTTFSELALKIYPIGSIYISINNTSPAELFGGTWTAWGTGRVPVGINTSDTNFSTVEKTGGSADAVTVSHTHLQVAHTHTVGNNSASHKHTVTGAAVTSGSNSASHTHGTGASNFYFGTHYSVTTDAVARRKVGSGGSYYALTSSDIDYIYERSATGTQSANHTHSVPTHAHTVSTQSANHTHKVSGGDTTTGSTGESGTGKNLQPYITCYMWKRTA